MGVGFGWEVQVGDANRGQKVRNELANRSRELASSLRILLITRVSSIQVAVSESSLSHCCPQQQLPSTTEDEWTV